MQRREKQNVLAHSLQLLGEVNMSVVVAAMAEERMGQPSAAHQEIALVNAEEGAGEALLDTPLVDLVWRTDVDAEATDGPAAIELQKTVVLQVSSGKLTGSNVAKRVEIRGTSVSSR